MNLRTDNADIADADIAGVDIETNVMNFVYNSIYYYNIIL